MADSVKAALAAANRALSKSLGRGMVKMDVKYDATILPKTIARVGKSADKAYEATCKLLNHKLVIRTPRDTGRAQSGWNASIGSPDLSERERFTKKGTYPQARTIISENNRVFRGLTVSQRGVMTNNVPYIRFLENGRSDQAPQGWIKLTLMEMYGVYPRHYAAIYANGYTRDLGGDTTSL
jgi:hypothetical protein